MTVYEIVTEKIIDKLREGVIPFRSICGSKGCRLYSGSGERRAGITMPFLLVDSVLTWRYNVSEKVG